MEAFFASLEPLLQNIYVHIGAAALGGFVLGWVARGLFARPRAVAHEAADEAAEETDTPAPQAAPSGEALTVLPGMTEALAAKLGAAGVRSVDDLWSAGHDREALHTLADSVQLEDFVLRKWVNAADLMRLPAMTPLLADALIRCGARGVAALAGENADRIQHKLAAYEEKNSVLGGAPDRAAVVALIDAAAGLDDSGK